MAEVESQVFVKVLRWVENLAADWLNLEGVETLASDWLRQEEEEILVFV